MPSHRRTLDVDEVILKNFGLRRIGRVGMYLFLILAGMTSFIYPALLISEQVGETFVLTLSILCALSAAICMTGSIAGRWIAEYVMLPFLALDLLGYGIVAWIASQQQAAPSLAAFGFLIIAFGLGLSGRWEDVRAVSKVRSVEARAGLASKE